MQNLHDSRPADRSVRFSRLLACASLVSVLAACGGGGGAEADSVAVVSEAVVKPIRVPISTPTPVPTPTPTPTARPAGFLGINVSGLTYYGGDRQFMNLLVASGWADSGKAGWPALPAAQVDRNGDLVSLAAGQHAVRIFTPPAASWSGAGAAIRCTWTGTAKVAIIGAKKAGSEVYSDHAVQFFMPTFEGNRLTVLDVSAMSNADPIRNLDCREPDADRQALFSPEFVDALKPFGILRFLDWTGVNNNAVNPQWADRTPPNGLNQTVVAWENMVSLARTLDADAWYNVPYDANEEYVVRLGKLIHDLTPANRKVYVELSNEVWNTIFGATTQARREGIAEGLDPANPARATLLRYAEKSTWLMKLWTPIFADRPGQLVRVVSTQDVVANSAEQVLGFRDTAQWVDALATAPYFGYDVLPKNPNLSIEAVMPLVAAAARDRLATSAAANAAVAKKYGKRYIAYEAGQLLLDGGKVDRLAAANRHPAMYDIYREYLAGWQARYGDTMMLFASTRMPAPGGAGGLRERAGQALSEAPKYRAAVTFGR